MCLITCAVQVAVTVASSKKKYRVGELDSFLRDIGETTLVRVYRSSSSCTRLSVALYSTSKQQYYTSGYVTRATFQKTSDKESIWQQTPWWTAVTAVAAAATAAAAAATPAAASQQQRQQVSQQQPQQYMYSSCTPKKIPLLLLALALLLSYS
jgi:hypothetical protein